MKKQFITLLTLLLVVGCSTTEEGITIMPNGTQIHDSEFFEMVITEDTISDIEERRPERRNEIILAPTSDYTIGNAVEFFESLSIIHSPRNHANFITWNHDFIDVTYLMRLVDENYQMQEFSGHIWSYGTYGLPISYRLERNTLYYLWIVEDQHHNPINRFVEIRK